MPTEKHIDLLTLQRDYDELFEKGKIALQSIVKGIRDNNMDDNYKLELLDLHEELNEISFYFVGINFFVRIEHDFTSGKLIWGIKYIDDDEEIRKPYVVQNYDHLGNLNNTSLVSQANKFVIPTIHKIINDIRAEDKNKSFEFK